jgi:hypothetical protein
VQAAGEQVRFPECVGRLAVLAAEV